MPYDVERDSCALSESHDRTFTFRGPSRSAGAISYARRSTRGRGYRRNAQFAWFARFAWRARFCTARRSAEAANRHRGRHSARDAYAFRKYRICPRMGGLGSNAPRGRAAAAFGNSWRYRFGCVFIGARICVARWQQTTGVFRATDGTSCSKARGNQQIRASRGSAGWFSTKWRRVRDYAARAPDARSSPVHAAPFR